MGIDKPDIDPEAFLDNVEMRVGEIVSVEAFPEARKDVYKLDVDFGDEILQSAAGLTRYGCEELLGRQVIAVVNLGIVSIAGYESQCLVTGVDATDGDGVVHLQPESDVENGARVY